MSLQVIAGFFREARRQAPRLGNRPEARGEAAMSAPPMDRLVFKYRDVEVDSKTFPPGKYFETTPHRFGVCELEDDIDGRGNLIFGPTLQPSKVVLVAEEDAYDDVVLYYDRFVKAVLLNPGQLTADDVMLVLVRHGVVTYPTTGL
jgi:hypothetical protein